MSRTRSLTRRAPLVALSLFSVSLAACDAPESTEPNLDMPEFGVTEDELGTALPSCSTAGSSGYNTTTKVLTLALTGSVTTIVLSADKGVVTVNGWSCVSAAGASLTTANVSKILVNGSNANEKVILDNLPGPFGTTIFSATTGGIVVDLGTGTDSFMLRGSSGVDKYQAGMSAAGDVYYDLTNDNKADVRVIGADNLTVSLLGGADTFHANGGAISAAHLVSTVTALSPFSASTPVTVYGGDGNDELRGGDGDDVFWAGPGDDTFKTSATDDGADTYHGEAGSDLVDYSNRSAALSVDVGAPSGTARGSVVLSGLTYGASGDLDTDDLVLSVDGAADVTVTFAAPANAADVVSQINTALGATVASLSSGGRLVLASPTTDPTAVSSVEVVSGTGSSVADLGLTVGVFAKADADDGISGENDDVQFDIEKVNGGSGADTLIGSVGSNILSGNGGNDTLSGGPGAASCASDVDVLNGGDGNDVFDMGAESDCGDVLNGGNGTDEADYQARVAALTITIDTTANDGQASEADKVFTDIERVLGGTAGDTITGSAAADELHGGPGNDTLNGGTGNDTLVGDTGNDTLNGDAGDDLFLESGNDPELTGTVDQGAGDDVINGGAGLDKISYAARTATVDVTLCVDAADVVGLPTSNAAVCTDADGEGAEADKLTNLEWVVGGDGDDNLAGGSAAETFEGGLGADTILGNGGDDVIYGEAGDDVLNGGDGDDYIDGGAGDDDIIGGASDGDICVGDASDVTAQVTCEL